jgi:hypothetical protein
MAINLARNTRLWVSTSNSRHDNSNTFEIPVQEGYTLSQSVSTSDVTVDEAGPAPTRGSKRFNDSLDPVEWSFGTYISPYTSGGRTYLVDMVMWQGLAVARAKEPDFDDLTSESNVKSSATKFSVDFGDNSAHVLNELYMYFLIDNQMYLVSRAQVGQAELGIDISDIGMVTWSGQAISYEAIPTPPFALTSGGAFNSDSPVVDSYVAIPANKKYLVNKLTIMDLNSDVAPGADDFYNIPITGASLTINNNITYLTPSTLSEVDKPIGSFTGSFDVSGSVDAYLRDTGGTGTAGSPYGSAELLSHMLANVGAAVTNAANLVLHIGGKAVGDPSCVITIPNGHLSVPEFNAEDVVSSSMEIKGIPTSTDLTSGTEVFIDFYAANV